MKEMVLGGSVLILLLALLRRLLRGRIDPRIIYALWLLAAARLLIPGTLFPSPAALPTAEIDPAAVAGEAMDAVLDWGNDLPLVTYRGSERTWTPSWVPEEEMSGKVHGDTQGNATYLLTATWTGFFRFWAPVIWAAGAAATALWFLFANWSFGMGLYAKRRRLDLPPAAGAGRLRVYGARELASPCLFGLFRPAVYLDDRDLSPDRLRHILVHEYTHFRHGDHVWALVRCACLTAHWYNPLVWWAAAMSRRDCELACDAGALDRLGDGERIAYGETLLAVAAGQSRPGNLLRISTAMNESKKTMKERIGMIVKRPKMLKITLVLVLAAAALSVAVTFGGRAAEAAGPEDGASAGDGVTPPDGGGQDAPSVRPQLTDEEMRANGQRILESIASGAEPSEWLPLLRDLHWLTAFGSEDPGVTTERIIDVMDALYPCVRGELELTDQECLDILSANQDLDGAFAEYYQDLVWRMFQYGPDRFIRLLQGMDGETRSEVLWWVKAELAMGGYVDAGSSDDITDEEAMSLLMTDLLLRVYVESPIRLAPGETAQIQIGNLPEDPADYTVTYRSDNTAVATVSDTGLVTAVEPWLATVAVDFKGYGGERAFYCYVSVDPPEPEDDELVEVLDYIPTLYVDLKYATEDNFTGGVSCDFT